MMTHGSRPSEGASGRSNCPFSAASPSAVGRENVSEIISRAAERGMKFHCTGLAFQSRRLKLQRQKDFRRDVVLAAYAVQGGRREAKTRIVLRMSEDDDGGEAELPAAIEARPHERRPDAFFLPARRHRHRGKAHH